MKTIIRYAHILTVFAAICSAATAFAEQSDQSWEVTFHDVTSARKGISTAYCRSHSPDVLIASRQEVLAGAKAKNGITVKQETRKEFEKNGLYFITANVVFSGFYGGKPWESKGWIHEQQVTPNGATDAVWSTADCKGKFTARPTQ